MAALAAASDNVLRITRVFDASPQRVFDAWTRPEMLSQWFGPATVHSVTCDLDVRKGGAWRLRGQSPKGFHAASGRYLEIVPPKLLSFTWGWHTEGDYAKPREHETIVTLTFRAVGNGTEMAMEHGAFRDADGVVSHNSGWSGSFDKLAALLGGATQEGKK